MKDKKLWLSVVKCRRASEDALRELIDFREAVLGSIPQSRKRKFQRHTEDLRKELVGYEKETKDLEEELKGEDE